MHSEFLDNEGVCVCVCVCVCGAVPGTWVGLGMTQVPQDRLNEQSRCCKQRVG